MLSFMLIPQKMILNIFFLCTSQINSYFAL